MCGIAGVIGDFSAREGLASVTAMTAALIHRGPDDQGTWARDGFAFGIRRLSIIDLPGGHQPMWTDSGIGIVFNGEIYNYRKLREELLASGYVFKTHSDTEVILNLYHRDGLAAVSRLEGMFAICVYDPGRQAVHFIRDRLGVKPLYYGRINGRFHFASEIKAIIVALAARPELNRQALHHYLTLRYVPAPDTIWKTIQKVEPGHILTLHLATQQVNVQRYWQTHFGSLPVEPGRDYLKEFEALFLAAVEKRLLAADVPVGTLLSGGLDSSAVSAAAVELGHHDFHTFSVAFSDGGTYDETGFARLTAAHTGSRHHEIIIGQKEFIDFLPDLVTFSDEPLADLASIPLYFVSRLARSEVKVVLSGEGADEVFAGYSLEQLATLYRRIGLVGRIAPHALLRAVAAVLPHGKYRSALADLAQSGLPGFLAAQARHMTRDWDEAEKDSLWKDNPGCASSIELIRSWYRDTRSSEPIDQLQEVFCRSWLVEDLLMKADRMSMANSLELRVPFLDHLLVEWAAALPLAWKVGDRESGPVSKRIVREFCRQRLPADVLNRPKQGFPVPAYGWLRESLAPWAQDIIAGPESRMRDWFDVSQALPVLERARQGDNASAHKIWNLIVLEFWMRRWL